ncbi:Uncharacterised protein [uncultured archaeon]|nr:Uncharacterised protein [uncultured archaeon]
MSTRCQLVVEENEEAKVYKHCDGYPSGVLPTLKKLLPAFEDGRGWDPAYLTAHLSATLIQDDVTDRKAFNRKMKKSYPNDPAYANRKFKQDFLSHGIDTQWHGDIEFAYRITKDFGVEVYSTPWGMKDLSQAKLVRRWTLDELVKARKFE